MAAAPEHIRNIYTIVYFGDRSKGSAASESRSSAVKVEETVFTSTESKWRNDKGTIVVLFLNGEVQRKIFYEPGAEPPPVTRN